ncbi:MAG: phosphate-starvation-inducible PsiE family protein [Candidatus Gracilibacteria bacterium]|nr:phosphate-starvation-inducible PsiE family protein [Candidatus Gracilibacteria bacterium]
MNIKSLQEKPLTILEGFSKIIAYVVCIGLLIASSIIVFTAFQSLLNQDLKLAIQDGLYVLILLEMFYVTRSFIRHGSINVSIVVNVGIIAAIKEMIFQLDNLTMQTAIGFGVIFVTLGITYLMEVIYYKKIFKEKMQD